MTERAKILVAKNRNSMTVVTWLSFVLKYPGSTNMGLL